ncbi:hypothetical protein L249_5047 [Ophiocordyceps polyrhachis-furcata BCC 54312]|uniref:RRM domain-containing protein n=1 Tax=Ophiocordyceps polyrhachis-furcata BCC 54312 TaxID=1330021 RepID=A0A367L4G2_9HYPO|nr:hypothetical protein L249_5047 [Ophiocordyceps polyrhachis-furcata BCC 54312]
MAVKTEKAAADSSPEKAAKASKRKASAASDLEIDLSAPEPPSKRARRALKKGRSVSKTAGGAGSGAEEEQDGSGDDAGKDKKARSEHGIWIGNLPFTVTPAELRQWLVDHSGEVITSESVTRIKMPKTAGEGKGTAGRGINKGFAYVDFIDLSTQVAAMALSETELGGRKLLIKDATSFEGRPSCKDKEEQPTTTAKEGDGDGDGGGSRKIFVGNMSFKTTEDDLARHFAKCGEIESIKMATFEDSGTCKGYGWVRFLEAQAAASAVKGFIKIKEKIETHRDFGGDDDDDDDEGKGGEYEGEEKPRFKTRKWWVNQLLGRRLRLELAEDDQTRYRKRFGKDAIKHKVADSVVKKSTETQEEPKKTEQDIATARLMGTLVEHKGTKVTFD